MSSVSSSPISAVALKPPSFESTAAQNPALLPEFVSSSGDTYSSEKEKSSSGKGFWSKVKSWFSPKEPGSNPSSEKGIVERLKNCWLFKTKDESGNTVSNWLGKILENFSKSSKDEVHRLTPPRL